MRKRTAAFAVGLVIIAASIFVATRGNAPATKPVAFDIAAHGIKDARNCDFGRSNKDAFTCTAGMRIEVITSAGDRVVAKGPLVVRFGR